MDMLKLQEEVKALQKLCEHYENQLHLIGFELCDLPDDVTVLIDDALILQRATNLHDLDLNYIKEYYYAKKKERIEQNSIMAKQRSELKQLTLEIEANVRELETLEKFNSSVNKRVVSDAELERTKLMWETKTQSLLERQMALKLPEDFNIAELIKKIDLLKQHDEHKRKFLN